MMETISDSMRMWNEVGGDISPDGQALIEELVGKVITNRYREGLHDNIYTESTFDPLFISPSITGAVEKYLRDREKSVDPIFLNALTETKKYNSWQKQQHGKSDLIEEVKITDYTTFLYLAERVIEDVRFQEPEFREIKTKTKITRNKVRIIGIPVGSMTAEEYDVKIKQVFPNLIIMLTNTEMDRLPSVLRPSMFGLRGKNVGLNVINLGKPNSKEITQFSNIPGFSYVNATLNDPSDKDKMHFGVYTTSGSISGRFSDFPSSSRPLLDLENTVDATFKFPGTKQEMERGNWESTYNNFVRSK